MRTYAVSLIFVVICLVMGIMCIGLLVPDIAHAQTTDVSCAGWFSNLSPTCIWRSLAAFAGAGLIWIAGFFLSIASGIFNWVLHTTVVGFDDQIYGAVAGGIQSTWTAFRDLANIAIIGIFVFIAIEMILGTQTFGGRKMIANVLIVAVLINFSLLFSRVIVESANFIAKQFYQAVQIQTVDSTGTGAAAEYGTGVAGRLAQIMGVAGFKETGDALSKRAEKDKSGWTTLGHGIMTAIVFMGAAAVFLYGAFLLISRAILLIFLIMTSSLAFAAFLLPSSMGGGYWSLWWRTLLQNSLLAPLLIIMLWATLQVGTALMGIRGTSKIGSLIDNPAGQGGLSALFSYIIILGMLYVSFRVSSMMAQKISGFDYASRIPAFGAGMLARTVGFAGRRSIGWSASKLADTAQNASRNTNLGLGTRQTLDRVAQNLRKGAKADYNPLKAKIFGQSLGAEIQKTAGLKRLETIAGKDLGGYDGAFKKKTEAAAEQAERITPKNLTDKEMAALREQVAKEQVAGGMQTNLTDDGGKTEVREQVAKERAESARPQPSTSNTSKELHEATTRLADMQKQQTEATQEFTAKIDEMTKQMEKVKSEVLVSGNNPQTDPKVKELQQSIEREKSQHKAELKSQEGRIEHAREMMKKAEETHQQAEKQFNETLNEKIADRLSVGATAARVANNRWGNVFGKSIENDPLAQAARKAVGEKTDKKRMKERLEALVMEERKAAPLAEKSDGTK